MTIEQRALGRSGIEVPAIGIGTWSWGDKGYWGYGKDYTQEDITQSYTSCVDRGLNFFDTAEVYGRGDSERLLGENHQRDGRPIIIATKFAPLPDRLTARTVLTALKASLQRLRVDHVDLYQIHWPYTFLSIDALMDAMADAVKAGMTRAVGVSNYNAAQLRRAHDRLAQHGIALASNQVHYSLLHRKPEQNGVLAACRERGIALIAYTPLEQGLLTGKYRAGQTSTRPGALTTARRLRNFASDRRLQRIEPLFQAMEQVGQIHGKTIAQVAVNWLLQTDPLIIPIPGAKNSRQVADNAGALGWQMTREQYQQISALAK